jgi:hypothetical protein
MMHAWAIGRYDANRNGTQNELLNFLQTNSISACVGLVIYDPVTHVGVVAHINPLSEITQSFQDIRAALLAQGVDLSRVRISMVTAISENNTTLPNRNLQRVRAGINDVLMTGNASGRIQTYFGGAIMLNLQNGAVNTYYPSVQTIPSEQTQDWYRTYDDRNLSRSSLLRHGPRGELPVLPARSSSLPGAGAGGAEEQLAALLEMQALAAVMAEGPNETSLDAGVPDSQPVSLSMPETVNSVNPVIPENSRDTAAAEFKGPVFQTPVSSPAADRLTAFSAPLPVSFLNTSLSTANPARSTLSQNSAESFPPNPVNSADLFRRIVDPVIRPIVPDSSAGQNPSRESFVSPLLGNFQETDPLANLFLMRNPFEVLDQADPLNDPMDPYFLALQADWVPALEGENAEALENIQNNQEDGSVNSSEGLTEAAKLALIRNRPASQLPAN